MVQEKDCNPICLPRFVRFGCLFLQCVGSWSVMDLDWICFYGASFHVPRCGALLSMNLYALRRSLVCLPAMQSACCRGTKICTPDPLIEKLGSGTFFFDFFCMRKWSVPWGTPTDAFLIVGYTWGGICCLYLSFVSVVWRVDRAGGGEADAHLNSNNPTLKGGE
jgi:hypothetical protein